jgi:hypothetical protein
MAIALVSGRPPRLRRGMSWRVLATGLALLMAVSAARAGDIILNGDFSDGKTHWRGDGDAPDTGGRLVVTLKPGKWTVVRQTFNSNAPALKLKLTYALSSDCTLGKSGDTLVPPLTAEGLREASGLDNGIGNLTVSKRELFIALVVGGGFVFSENPVYDGHYSNSDIVTNSDGSQTYTAQVTTWNGSFVDANLCLCFPPGQGTVTLTAAALTPPGQ